MKLFELEHRYDKTTPERILNAEHTLTHVKDELKISYEISNELLERQEVLDDTITQEPMKSKNYIAELLSFYGKKRVPDALPKQRDGLALEIK